MHGHTYIIYTGGGGLGLTLHSAFWRFRQEGHFKINPPVNLVLFRGPESRARGFPEKGTIARTPSAATPMQAKGPAHEND